MQEPAIDTAADIGGTDADDAVWPVLARIKKRLRRDRKNRNYSPVIDEFVFIFRVDGEISQFGFEGCEAIDLSLRDRYISIDVGVPLRRWQGKSEKEILEYLVPTLIDGMKMMLGELEKMDIPVEKHRIMSDLKRMLADV